MLGPETECDCLRRRPPLGNNSTKYSVGGDRKICEAKLGDVKGVRVSRSRRGGG